MKKGAPDPALFNNWREWANELRQIMAAPTTLETTRAEPLLLATVDPIRPLSAAAQGVVMYHPTHGPIVSRGGQWYKVELTGPVVL